MPGGSANAAAGRPSSVVIAPERRSSTAHCRQCRLSASALMRRSSARPEMRPAYPTRQRSRVIAGSAGAFGVRSGTQSSSLELLDPLADPPLEQSRSAFMGAQIAARLQLRPQLPQPDGEIVERHEGVRRLRRDPRQPLQRAADKAARPAVAPAQHAACPYRDAEPRLPCMRELPGDIGIWSVIERRHDPQQPGCRQLRVGHVEKRRQRGLDQLDRDAPVPDTLGQTPADIVENFRPGPIGEV